MWAADALFLCGSWASCIRSFCCVLLCCLVRNKLIDWLIMLYSIALNCSGVVLAVGPSSAFEMWPGHVVPRGSHKGVFGVSPPEKNIGLTRSLDTILFWEGFWLTKNTNFTNNFRKLLPYFIRLSQLIKRFEHEIYYKYRNRQPIFTFSCWIRHFYWTWHNVNTEHTRKFWTGHSGWHDWLNLPKDTSDWPDRRRLP